MSRDGPSLTPLPSGAIVVAEPQEWRSVRSSGRSSYPRSRPRWLLPTERETVRVAAARGRSLRDLAADFGVSHETIRAVLRSDKESVLTLESTRQRVNGHELAEVGKRSRDLGVDPIYRTSWNAFFHP